ncbi:DUF3037 domain-containing protein [Paractinoplanes lichenicola]|uniref:DUF3037 domain-containing protein n=1 Tax=Paractinoplanes lichenicola TaxID=2802976 RepID=A0ABS1VR22_9ACTN|nr:DUF3037 domain-containing protein [Actinoplanes lichenicola]MBL7257120.1 DUF3037 domain-containing protein [Actinoplanes lichenicola]
MRYVYSVIKYVPVPSTGEFVNVGVIAGSDETGDWSLRKAENPRRARLFGTLDSLNAVDAFMNELGSQLDGFTLMQNSDVSEAWLAGMQRRYRNVVQLTAPAPIIAESAEDALNLIFPRMILEEAGAMDVASRSYATRQRIFSELKASYRWAQIGSQLVRERTQVVASGIATNMDFVIGNGKVIQLAHTWSFQLNSISDVSRDVKSWAFGLERLIDGGGEVVGDGAEVPANTPIEVVYAPPKSPAQEKAFAEAMRVFNDLKVIVLPQSDVRRVADDARKRLQQHGVSVDLMSP